MGQENTAPRKINKVEGAAGQLMQFQGPGNVEQFVNPSDIGVDYGLSFIGTVTGVAGAPKFQCSGLIGFGDAFFNDYWAYVVWDAAGGGAQPQGQKLICTGYSSVDADFTVAAFAPNVIAVGDKVLFMHPSIARVLDIYTETNQLPNVEHETEWASDATIQALANAAASPLNVGSITPTYPTGATRVRAILIASIHVANKTAVAHHIKFKVEGQKAAGGYGDLVSLIAQEGLSMVDVDGATDGWSGAIDVTALVDTSGAVYDFRFEVDSDNAGNVIYVCSFVLALVYTM